MVEIDKDMKIEVALRDSIEGNEGNESVQIAFTGGEPHPGINLEPSQARALATEIIETVNRAEVKRKLKNRYPAHRQHRMG